MNGLIWGFKSRQVWRPVWRPGLVAMIGRHAQNGSVWLSWSHGDFRGDWIRSPCRSPSNLPEYLHFKATCVATRFGRHVGRQAHWPCSSIQGDLCGDQIRSPCRSPRLLSKNFIFQFLVPFCPTPLAENFLSYICTLRNLLYQKKPPKPILDMVSNTCTWYVFMNRKSKINIGRIAHNQ